MIDVKPAFIVQCSGTADVILATQFATEHNLLISVRAAGHNIAGRAMQDNVMLIDLSGLRSVRVNPDKQTVVVSPGATLGDIDHETQIYGLACPTGINSTTGISGLTLGGGFGWLSRKHGMTVDNLISAEVITINGERLLCNESQHDDLFWAIKGGGGNFGIVTAFEFQCHRVGPELMCGPIVFSLDEADSVLKKYREFCQQAPDELSAWVVLRGAPPFPFLDPSMHGKPVLIIALLYSGPMEEAKPYIDQIAAFGHPIANAVSPHRFVDFQQAFDPLLTPGARNYWKSHNFTELNDDLFNVLLNYADKLPSAESEIFFAQMGGATNRVEPDSTAYPHRNVEFIMNVHTRWQDSSQDETCIQWARDFFQATAPFSTGGVYVNFVSQGDDSVDNAYGKNTARLMDVKAKYDPNNCLRANLNIDPT